MKMLMFVQYFATSRGEFINSNRLRAIRQEAANPRDQRSTHTEVNELRDKLRMVWSIINPVESFIEMKKANAEIFPMVVEVFNVSQFTYSPLATPSWISRLAQCIMGDPG
jgi:hypothetical protein